ncbi:MAG TPA: TIGR03067 domain-containing protein [Xanthomonadaceae bacterium]
MQIRRNASRDGAPGRALPRRVLCALALSLAISGCSSFQHVSDSVSHVSDSVVRVSGSVFGHSASAVEPDVPAGAALVGQWTPVSAEMGGKDFPVANFGGASLNLSEHGYEFAGDRGNYVVLSEGSPSRMDIHGEQGPNAGRLIPTLYEISGDTLTICYQLGPGVRPHDFNSAQGPQILLVRYRRSR